MTSVAAAAGRPQVGFGATLASEWTKLATLRSTYVVTGLAVVLAVSTSAVVALVTGQTYGDWSAADRADFDPVLYPLIGGIVLAILLPILGVRAVTGEYSTGMIRLTLTATPRRERVVLAKACAVSAVVLVTATIATVLMFLAAQLVYGEHGLETASLLDGDALRAVFVSSALAPVFPVIAVALAVVFRSTVGAIVTVLALVFLPGILGGLLPGWWQESVDAYLPGSAADSVAISHLTETELGPASAALVLAGWLAAFLAAACVAMARRDA
jgi:ABC-2 type transport system permease protein